MRGLIDLHCHYIPKVDDGVTSMEEGVRLCQGLARIGYDVVVATPHIRTMMFDNDKQGLVQAFEEFRSWVADTPGLPELGLGCEHFCDDVFWERFEAGGILAYPGGKAALIEFATDAIPLHVDRRLFHMNVRGIRPVLAHPERYAPLFRSTAAIEPLLTIGVLPLLDIMALVGKYGRKPRYAAERMLEEDVYFAACTDCHRPADVEAVEEAIDRLRALVGDERLYLLLSEHPRQVLEGSFEGLEE